MPTDTLVWIIASASLALLVGAGVLWLLRQRRDTAPALPREWTLTARPVFNSDERRVYRQLREALPHHIVLSKLPLVRFCQPTDPEQVRYWYELLGSIHVGFAVCSANGRVLAAIDIDTDRQPSRRALQIKQKVLAACRVRYLRCPVDHLPSVPELQLLVPYPSASARGPQAAPAVPATAPMAAGQRTNGARARPARALWQDSGFFQDSFFGAETRADTVTDFDSLGRGRPAAGDGLRGDDGLGVDARSSPVRH